MHDEDCCENCMFFVKETTLDAIEHHMEPSPMYRAWVPYSVTERFFAQESPTVSHTTIMNKSYCRRGHERTPKDKAEWCGEYKAKD